MWDDGPQWQNVCFRGEPRWSLIRILLEILWIAMIGINGGCHQQTWLGNTIDGYNQRRIYVDGGYPKHVTWTGTWTGKWWDCKSWDSGVPYFQSSSYVESVLRMLKPCKSFLLSPDFQKHLFLEQCSVWLSCHPCKNEHMTSEDSAIGRSMELQTKGHPSGVLGRVGFLWISYFFCDGDWRFWPPKLRIFAIEIYPFSWKLWDLMVVPWCSIEIYEWFKRQNINWGVNTLLGWDLIRRVCDLYIVYVWCL